MRQLSTDKLYELEKEFLADKKNIVAMNAAVQSGIRKVATDINKIKENPYKFNIDINNGDVCNQKSIRQMLDVCFIKLYEKCHH